MLVLGFLRRRSHAGQSQPLSVTSLGLYGGSYKAIHSWSLPVLDPEICERSRDITGAGRHRYWT